MTSSIWEEQSFLQTDVVVIGAGIIGISTALSLVEHMPSLKVCVVERGMLPMGASSRNAGFACFGSAGELWKVMNTIGTEAAVSLVQQRVDGLALLRSRAPDDVIDYRDSGGHELFMGDHEALHHLDHLNAAIKPIMNVDVYNRVDHRIGEHGLSNTIHAMVSIHGEGMLHSGKLMQHLWKTALSKGVQIFTGSEAIHIDNSRVVVRTGDVERTINTSYTVLATNALVSRFAPDIAVKPGRGQVVVTSPIEHLKLHGTYHYDDGFCYFRNVGDRVLLGGGRNRAFEEETTSELENTQSIVEFLHLQLREIILPNCDFTIDYTWAGTMGFSANGLPVVQFVDDNIVVAFGCNGMGVALGSTIAYQAASLILSA